MTTPRETGTARRPFIAPRKYALVYVVKIITGCTLLWYGLRALGLEDPVWALITLVILTEPDFPTATAGFRVRAINTLLGCAVASIALLVLGGSFLAMVLAATLAAAAAMLVRDYPDNWRLAPATAIILSAAAIHHSSLAQGLMLVALRAGEVFAGGAVALLQSFVYTLLMRRLKRPVGPGAIDAGD